MIYDIYTRTLIIHIIEFVELMILHTQKCDSVDIIWCNLMVEYISAIV